MSTQPGFMHRTNLQQMYDDIVKVAGIAEVPCNREAIWKVFGAFGDFYSGSAVSFVTNTRPKERRGFSIRYVEIQVPHDAYEIALEHGLIVKEGHAIEDVIPEIRSNYSIQGYGVDLAAAHGFAKIWQFFRDLPTLDQVCTISSLPASVRECAEHFAEYGLRYVSLFALDFRHKTTNMYFMVKHPDLFPPDRVARMIEDLGLKMPTDELLEHCSRALTIYPTFSWNSSRVERLCFGTIAPDPSMVPAHLDPLIRRYVTEAPMSGGHRTFIYSITLAPDEIYIKIENDYTGTMSLLMRGATEVVP